MYTETSTLYNSATTEAIWYKGSQLDNKRKEG